MSQILYKVESTERYDSHVVGIYSNIEDANKRLAMVCLDEVMYTSYAIYEMVIDLNVEKLREGYHTFQFDRQRTERGVKVSVYENYSELNERFHYSPKRKIEHISILARNMKEAQDLFYSERERLLDADIQNIKKNVDLKLNPDFIEYIEILEAGAIPVVEEKEYYVGNEEKLMDNSLGVFDDLNMES